VQKSWILIISITLSVVIPALGWSQYLRIGYQTAPSTIDPHLSSNTTTLQTLRHLYDPLIYTDGDNRLLPGLAVSWKAVTPTLWRIQLRKGVTFHDGKPFGAEDVVFSLERIRTIESSFNPFNIYVKPFKAVHVIDEHTLEIETKEPFPLMPRNLSQIYIASKAAGAGASTADYNSGKAAVGTGPYKLSKFLIGSQLQLVRNNAWWGPKQEWEKVDIKVMPNDAARMAALLAGDVDLIEQPALASLEQLKRNPNIAVVEKGTSRVIYLGLNQGGEPCPGVTGTEGKNPLKDQQVRRALSKAINRKAIVERILLGMGTPAGQVLPAGMAGHHPQIVADAYDPEEAKQLLAAAGYPGGFSLSLITPNDRYLQDEQVAQAIAQMWTRVGVKTAVEAAPFSAYRNALQPVLKHAVYLSGFGSTLGDVSAMINSAIAAPSKETGYGSQNYGHYANPKLDAVLKSSYAEMDEGQRNELLLQTVKMASDDVAYLPLHWEKTAWAMKKDLTYEGRVDQQTTATWAKPR
jgi:peptide/nickel transport system substrate-binding protein